MTDTPTPATELTLTPGKGITYDAATGALGIDLASLFTGLEVTVAAKGGGAWKISLAQMASSIVAATDFDASERLAAVSFLGTAAPSWSFTDGVARLVPANAARSHGIWSTGTGDGRYRCLFRLKGGLPASVERRFSFGARIGFANGDWNGIRVEPFETGAGARRLHIREYTGASGVTTSLATAEVAWTYDTWTWLDTEVAGTSVRGRIYPEAAAAPDWQVAATTTQTAPGGFGPGAFPAANLPPVVEIRRLEFTPAA